MKKNIFLLSFIVSLGFVSCEKRLDEVNPGGATADATWTTPQGFLTVVNGAYHEQRSLYGKEDGLLISEGGTDLWFNANKANYAVPITRYEGLSGVTPSVALAKFRQLYKAINTCNAGIN